MILVDRIKIKVNPNSRVHFKSLGYNCNNYELLEVNVLDLPIGSNHLIKVKCDICESINEIKYNRFVKNTKNNTIIYTCKGACSSFKTKKTKFEKYGDENYQNIEKIKKTKFERYGDENYTNREKTKETLFNKFGVYNVSNIQSVKESKIKTNLEKRGVENPFQSEEVKKKISESIMLKYGVYKYVESKDCKDKYNKFCERLGVTHYSKSSDYREKFENTCLLNWGFRTCLMNSDIKDKIKNTNIIKYGFDIACKNKEISLPSRKLFIEGRRDFFTERGYDFISYDYDLCLYTLKKIDCGHEFEINYDLFRSRIRHNNNSCLTCHPKDNLSSIKEVELGNFVKSLTNNVILNNRDLIGGKEIDIYVTDKKIGIEFNGLYWHSDLFKDKLYHYNKTKSCEENGISLIHIWEDDWNYKNEIVKSIIRNKLGLICDKIYSRKCKIVEVTNSVSNKFLEKNHIQGGANASICLALEYDNEIVSIMTFGKRKINSKLNLELIRFCNKINTSVIGSASKLFKSFIKNNDFDKITSYSDISIFDGGLYEKLGFVNDGETSLNYYWNDSSKRYHRFNFNKKRLVQIGYDPNKTEDEIMRSIGYYKNWSCGQIRWVYYKTNE